MKKTVSIEGMSCSHCTMAVKKALSKVDGVTDVEVDLDSGSAVVTMEAEIADDTLSAVVTDAGYDVTKIA